jgi:hypothetical protein
VHILQLPGLPIANYGIHPDLRIMDPFQPQPHLKYQEGLFNLTFHRMNKLDFLSRMFIKRVALN